MFYYIFIFIFVIIFLAAINGRHPSIRYLILTMVTYSIALYAIMIYLSKGSFYYNPINKIFSVPDNIWRILMYIPISRISMIRVLNISCLFVLYFGTKFSLSFIELSSRSYAKIYSRTILVIILVEVFLYDPVILQKLYYAVYPALLTTVQCRAFQSIFHNVSITLNATIVIVSIVLFFRYYFTASPLRFIRQNILSTGVFYTLIMASYIIVLGTYPNYLVSYSKLANTVTLLPVRNFFHNSIITKLFPFYLLATFLGTGLCLFRAHSTYSKTNQSDFSLSKQISAADTTSKVFCHYVKNEVLAIEAELDEIQSSDKNDNPTLKSIRKRCDDLYNRLDEIHRSTKSSELTLVRTDVADYLTIITNKFRSLHQEIDVNLNLPLSQKYYALIDTVYFEQALDNILINAIDAMEGLPANRHLLNITLQSYDYWIIISIEDKGKGISKENIDRIFTPFYSSSPRTKHWGVGLSLTHKIISAHEGSISVTSKLDAGTTFRITIPALR